MTNEERKEMYQEWENFVFEIFCQMKKNDGHDSRCALLIETIKDLGGYIRFDTTAFIEAISKYDKEACKPDVEPKVGDLAILKGDVWNTNFKVGSVVQVLGVTVDKKMVLIELINLDRVLYTTSVRAEILDIIGTSIRQEEV